ncbi:eukaryotic translation initiation factor 3 subunit J-like [Impatiens glandulifera]|uniref:eukaryotic translation initiation factor 3 subunit J-like n=1 Tax=Impatiens glandulifera TaxID=253017 RepID=UPI001FB116C5|nr:eukaryotic translation initiation factor 3 subunit J-like [Impatiens glandulifera]
MDDWEDEPVSPVIKKEQQRNAWDDEDVDEDGIKDSWEDEEEPTPVPAPVVPPAEKVPKKSTAKATNKKGKAVVEVEKEESLDPVAEKLRQQRLVEEADYKSTVQLFAKKVDEKSLDSFIPKSENDFLEYAELISHKLRPYEKSYHYIRLLKAVMRLSMSDLKAENSKEVASSVNTIANEKLKAEKEANAGKKKTGAKKKQLQVQKVDDETIVEGYDDGYDDYDFM